ncbi:hypothetical protein OIV83_003700 [Microbotryomycetes sp. JL201]|nr:hypothetical protein OIV83_003700 [Microbotryomycetes sp. JL201]
MSSAAAPAAGSKLQQLWNHPAGPKTVFFWAPMFKWALVAAGIKDLALTATGLIWVRYSFVITPVNYSLAAVNAFVATTGIASLYRAWDWQRKSPAEQAKIKAEREAQDLADKAKAAVKA